jgi:hypothetical protein
VPQDRRGPRDRHGRNHGVSNAPVADEWLEQKLCRNCGAMLTTAYRGGCGQKAAKRLVWRDLRNESWDRLRLFEAPSMRTLGRLIVSPGTVVRDYVLGRRAIHMHPLKLLVATVAVLVVMLAPSSIPASTPGSAAMPSSNAWRSRCWPIRTGASRLGSWPSLPRHGSCFRRFLDYDAIELAVLAVYCQSVILAVVIVNLPTAIWRSPEFVLAHKAASQHLVPVLKTLLVAVACRQSVLLRLRRDWSRLFLACILFVLFN